MRRTLSLAALAGLALGAISLSLVGDGWTQLGYLVGIRLQTSTPGTADTGHGNISGTMRASQFAGGGVGLTGVDAALLNGLPGSAFLQSVPLPLTLAGTSSGHIILGQNASTTSTSSGVYGRSSAASGITSGGRFETASTSGIAVWGKAEGLSGTTYGGRFETLSPTGIGAFGLAPAGSSSNYGVYGRSDSTLGTGVFGTATATSGANFGVRGETDSVIGNGVLGLASASTGSATGVYGESGSTAGRGVVGNATATTGTTYGVYGSNSSTGGRGIYGTATASTGTTYGVYGLSQSGTGVGVVGQASSGTGSSYGVHGLNSSQSGRGVYGQATSPTGGTTGVYGEAISGTGVFGRSTASSGAFSGVYGISDSTSGYAIRGSATASTGISYGVYATASSIQGTGVYGTSPYRGIYGTGFFAVQGSSFEVNGRGVYGTANSATGSNYGVRGDSVSPNSYGVYSAGDFGATGVKLFVIDHPLDPENKYLRHFCQEGPEPQNVYNGVVTTDGHGRAWVELPDYFAEINKDFRYQLTALDDTEGPGFVHVKVARKIRDNRFLIMSSAPNVEVSWEVKGVRNDLWVRSRGIEVEVEKGGHEKGKYQHPELYGLPASMGVDYVLPKPEERSDSRKRPLGAVQATKTR